MRGMIIDDVEDRHAESPGSGRVGRRATDALENHQLIGQRTGTACDPRAIADGQPRLRTGSHGHTADTGMKELGRYLRWSER